MEFSFLNKLFEFLSPTVSDFLFLIIVESYLLHRRVLVRDGAMYSFWIIALICRIVGLGNKFFIYFLYCCSHLNICSQFYSHCNMYSRF